jgi:hypothetical protein
LLPTLVFAPVLLQAEPFETFAAFAVVAKEVVARNRPNAAANTTDLVLFEFFTICISNFLFFSLSNTGYIPASQLGKL